MEDNIDIMGDEIKTVPKKNSGICPKCGQEFKYLPAHVWRCKGNTNDDQKDAKRPIIMKKPIKEDIVAYKTDPRTDEEKAREFFINAPLWVFEKPHGISRLFNGILDKRTTTKACVFVDDNEAAKVAYFPYDEKEKVLTLPNGMVYAKPLKGDVWFFHKRYFRPLLNDEHPKDEYDLPTDYITMIHNHGVLSGQIKSLDDIIAKIDRFDLLVKIAFGVAVIAILTAAIITKSYQDNYNALAMQINTLSNVIGGRV